MMNKVWLIGRLGTDPELRYAANGTPTTTLRIATSESFTDRDGNKVDRTEWHSVVVFQRQAENCKTYLRKGSLVLVEGSLQTRKWQDQQGQDRYITEVKAQRIQFLDRRGESEAAGVVHNSKQQHDEMLSDFDQAFSSKDAAMEDPPFGKPSPQRKQPRNKGAGDTGKSSEMDKVPF